MTDLELVDAERFADALETIEEGGEPDLDPREDPTLTALATLASEIREVERSATETPRFDSYRTRSRGYLLRSLELPRRVEETPRRRVIPFLRLSYLAPVASAAAAAAAVLAFVALQQGSPAEQPTGEQVAVVQPLADPAVDEATTQPPQADAPTNDPTPSDSSPADPAPPEALLPAPAPTELPPVEPGQEDSFVAIFIGHELARIDELIAAVADRVAQDQPVETELLRGITESTASVAQLIEAQPDLVSRGQVIVYIKAAADSRTLLAAVRADAEQESALRAARAVAQDGVVVASQYFARAR